MDTQFNDLSKPDPTVEYYCSPATLSRGFTHLMKLVLMVREVKTEQPLVREVQTEQPLVREVQTDQPLVGEVQTDQPLVGEVQTDQPLVGEVQTEQPLVGNNLEVISIIKTLAKVNINEINEKGWSALMIACRNSNTNSNIETVKILIDAGADINIKNNDAQTSLMWAFKY